MEPPTVVTERATFRSLAADAPAGVRVPVELRVSVADQPGWGYFAVDPVERLTVGTEAVVAEAEETHSPSLAALAGFLDGETLIRGDCEVPYPCGAFGWLSYDIARELEALDGDAVDDRGLPRLQVAVYDCVAAWPAPHDDDTALRITCCPTVPADATADDLDAIYESAVDRASSLAAAAVDGDPTVGAPPVEATDAAFSSDTGAAAFADNVRRIKTAIRDGDTFQTNLSQRLSAPAAVHPVEAYDALREVNPAPYSGLIEFSGRGDDRWSGIDLVSASPELLLEREGDRIRTEPIAGTRPRGSTETTDEGFEADLRGDDKERAEHAMLVDLERNDLGKVSQFGSVEVGEYRRIDRYAEVMHLVSGVEGRLREACSLADAVAAMFPGGTVTGAPKPKTMDIIDDLEATRRGPYTGSMAVFGFDGRATLNIIIRTLVRHSDQYHLRVGAGIVHDSEPEAEYEETLAKGRALVTAIDEALAASRLTVEEAPQ